MTNGTGRLQLGLLLRTGEQAKPAGRAVGWGEIKEMSLPAEAVGFDTIWMADHLIMRNAGSVVMEPGTSRGPRPGGPPIWIGAKGPRMLRLIAQYADAYNSVWHADVSQTTEQFGKVIETIRSFES